MSLKENIKDNIKKAMQQKDSNKLSVLRMLQASILNKEKEKRAKIIKADPDKTEQKVVKESLLTEEEVITAVMSEIKKRKDSIEQYKKGGRQDLVDSEKKELEVLMEYAPAQMSEEEVKKIVEAAIKKSGVSSAKDTGKVMSLVMPQVKGKAEGSTVVKVVQQLLK